MFRFCVTLRVGSCSGVVTPGPALAAHCTAVEEVNTALSFLSPPRKQARTASAVAQKNSPDTAPRLDNERFVMLALQHFPRLLPLGPTLLASVHALLDPPTATTFMAAVLKPLLACGCATSATAKPDTDTDTDTGTNTGTGTDTDTDPSFAASLAPVLEASNIVIATEAALPDGENRGTATGPVQFEHAAAFVLRLQECVEELSDLAVDSVTAGVPRPIQVMWGVWLVVTATWGSSRQHSTEQVRAASGRARLSPALTRGYVVAIVAIVVRSCLVAQVCCALFRAASRGSFSRVPVVHAFVLSALTACCSPRNVEALMHWASAEVQRRLEGSSSSTSGSQVAASRCLAVLELLLSPSPHELLLSPSPHDANTATPPTARDVRRSCATGLLDSFDVLLQVAQVKCRMQDGCGSGSTDAAISCCTCGAHAVRVAALRVLAHSGTLLCTPGLHAAANATMDATQLSVHVGRGHRVCRALGDELFG